jgi:hypothetical protein
MVLSNGITSSNKRLMGISKKKTFLIYVVIISAIKNGAFLEQVSTLYRFLTMKPRNKYNHSSLEGLNNLKSIIMLIEFFQSNVWRKIPTFFLAEAGTRLFKSGTSDKPQDRLEKYMDLRFQVIVLILKVMFCWLETIKTTI